MKTTINIELGPNETLQQAIDHLLGGAPCVAERFEESSDAPTPASDEAAGSDAEEKSTSKKATKKTGETKKSEARKKADPESGVSFEDIRATAMKVMNAGKRAEVENLLKEHCGSGRLKDVDPSEYAEVLEALKEML